jgi:hypothetical protein
VRTGRWARFEKTSLFIKASGSVTALSLPEACHFDLESRKQAKWVCTWEERVFRSLS